MISTNPIRLRSCGDETVKDFLSKTMDSFGKELNIAAKAMFQYPDGLKGVGDKESINDVFSLIERTFVGLFNNAVIRAFPSAVTLQEFSVYQKEEILGKDKSVGRADLLVVHETENGAINLVFEAKSGFAASKKYLPEETQEYYFDLYKQAYRYFEAEKAYYGGDSYVITITFDRINDENFLKEILEEAYEDDNCTDFYYIYSTDQAGLMVYGNVSKILSPAFVGVPSALVCP